MADAKKAQLKAAEKEAKAAKRAQRKQNYSQMWQAFNIQRKNDKALVPLMLIAVVGMAVLFFGLGLLFNSQWWMLPIGLALGIMLAMFIFTRRVEKSVYDQAENQPGAAGWALENLKSGVGMAWRTKTAIAANTHMDAVHRVIGNPGIVLVGEGEMHRLKPLMAQAEKRLNRVSGGVPIYKIYTGEGEDQVRIRNLQRELMKLPRNYKKDEVYALANKIEAMDHISGQGQPGLPKGPLPKGAKVSGMNRRARRQAERGGR
ncbi:DUF4191 domain-containing protein [Corynebacterium epidermidicanis]|uniref:Putative DUF4191 family protein n=1 Tax=Corynebacterium epidermidicanis TaxID=1050174 RepID=A0A0G3GXI5_9CORY|nr:DUF4191 domain-containing protein [Corynebacterium epidermidicanis]AKK03572.1 putative DUF4191 family protein [Corynebacterium epidermidicanis]